MTTPFLTEQEIAGRFSHIVAHSLHIDLATVHPETYLDEIGAESLDFIEIAMEVESQFNIWLPEKTILQTAEEIFGADTLEKDGLLTAAGKDLLFCRMPAADRDLFSGDVTVKAVHRYFMRVSTWVRMIAGLLEHTPHACSQCGGALAASLGFRMKCAACANEISLTSGDELNRQWVEQYHRSFFETSAGALPNAHAQAV